MSTTHTSSYKTNVSAGITALTGDAAAFETQVNAFFSKHPDAEDLLTANEAAEQIVLGVI
ncbi:hypothetical protein [Sulfitobacter sp. R18_1]|uniref:hypothetical protein n=1 Tax=Sulfitobacter sp. R18_1 TaxID=2821104 RepID=UPI001ADC42BA|nr:hypothetical protein [Sulfitobacter sp. R18_1]MBO9428006.1 hypothetical protein [Sulfitobacter sp. R18_1]